MGMRENLRSLIAFSSCCTLAGAGDVSGTLELPPPPPSSQGAVPRPRCQSPSTHASELPGLALQLPQKISK